MPFPESLHPYLSDTDDTQTYTSAGAGGLLVTFDPLTDVELHFDYIYVQDGSSVDIPGSPFTGTTLAGATQWVAGDTVQVRLTSDSSVEHWGYKVTSITTTGAVAIRTGTLTAAATALPYSATLATWSSGAVTWSITAGALPAGLTLDTATGAITGTPTVSGTFTFTVTADDGEGHTDTHEYTLAVYNGPVIAFYPYGNHLYTSFRDAPGHWTDPHLYATTVDPTVGGAYGITCGIEGATPATNPLGVAMTGSAGYVYYGQGQPDPQYSVFEPLTGNINVDNIDYPTYTVEPLGFDHMSAGVWLYSGDYWLIAVRSKNFTSENTIVALKAVSFDGDGFPTGWHAADLGSSNEPHCDANRFVSLRWDGSSSFFDLYGPASFTTNSTPRQLYTFDFSTETWGTPYGSVDPGAPTACALPVSASGNTIFRYPNDDIGIVYHYYATSPSTTLIGEIYYRLYDRATDSWGSEMLIISRGTGDLAGISTVIPDPGSEMLHLFEYRDHQSSPTAGDHVQHGTYHIVEHDGTFHGDLFEFPVLDGPAGQYEGWGHGVEFDGSLLVPRAQHWYSGDYPDYTRPPVEVWVGPTAGTGSKTFTAEHLPLQPTAPIDGIFTMYYLARASGSYVVIPPSSFSIFPQYIKSHNRFAH